MSNILENKIFELESEIERLKSELTKYQQRALYWSAKYNSVRPIEMIYTSMLREYIRFKEVIDALTKQ